MERIHISLLIYLVLGVIPAIIASQKGRSAVGWYLYGFLAFPIAFIHSILAIEVHRAPCPHCGSGRTQMNGSHHRRLRIARL